MKLKELKYDLLESVRGTLHNEDEIDLRQLEYWIHNQRALWLRNDLNKTLQIPTIFIQDLGLIGVSQTNMSGIVGIDSRFKCLRTEVRIPPLIRRHGKDCLIKVGSIYPQLVPFNIIDYGRVPYIGHGRFDLNHIFAFLIDEFVYIAFREPNLMFETINVVNVKGILENPTDAANFEDAEGNPCWTDDSTYPISRDLYNYMKAEILKLDLGVKVKAPSDKETDDNNSLNSSIKL